MLKPTVPLLPLTALLIIASFATGCVTTGDLNRLEEAVARAQSTADNAKAEAAEARTVADEAKAEAAAAATAAHEANEKAERMFKKAIRK